MAKKLKKRADGRYAKQFTMGIKDGKPQKKTVYGRTNHFKYLYSFRTTSPFWLFRNEPLL